SAVERTKQAASGEDVQAIKQAISDLKVAAQALARYATGDGQAGGHTPGGATAGARTGPGKAEDLIDLEVEENKERPPLDQKRAARASVGCPGRSCISVRLPFRPW